MALDSTVVNPLSQGKMKALWDAIRSAPQNGQDADPAVASPAAPVVAAEAPPALAQKVAEASMGAGPVAAPDGGALMPNSPGTQVALGVQDPGPAPVAPPAPQMAAPISPVLAQPAVEPNVQEVAPTRVPASDQVGRLQDEAYRERHPTLTHRLINGAIPLAVAGISAAAGGQGGAGAIGVNDALDKVAEQRADRRRNLTAQLSGAQTEREKEFDTAQRTVEAANATHEANRTRDIISRTLAGSREGVAETNAGAKRDVATTQATSRDTMADIAADAQRYRADKAAATGTYTADQRLRGAKYAADTAMARQSRSIDATDARQERGFTHTDDKPTAMEDQRADLSDAFKGYATELREIATRRPELFGKLAGRLTAARQTVGSDDPDVRAVKRIKEQLGTVSQGAHGLRNAGHIATAADSLMDMNDSADSIVKNIDDGMKGVDQFQTIHRPTLSTRTTPAPGPKPPAPSSGKPDYIYVAGKGLVKQ